MTSGDAPPPPPTDRSPQPAAGWREFPPLELSPILRAALEQIVESGYSATSVRSIAREVGVTVPALYYHFENKQALLAALLDHSMAIVSEHVDAAVADAGQDPVRQFAAMVEAIALYMAHHRDLAFLDSERRSLVEPHLTRYIEHRDRVEHQLRSAIEAGMRSGDFSTQDPSACGRAILSMCQGIAGWYRLDGPSTPEDVAARYVTIALAAVGHRAT